MVLQHNLASMFTNRQLGVTTNNQTKSSEKLSTGYRINRAADDAAGLSISENLRKQIRGLNKASKNTEDAYSYCQVADGAMGELQNIIHRAKELCVQGASDVNTDEDREAIQSELDALAKEVKNITKNTQFNTLECFERDFQSVTTNAAGDIIGSDVVSSANNNYGLGLILGKGNVSTTGSLDTGMMITTDNWTLTGDEGSGTTTYAEKEIMSNTPIGRLTPPNNSLAFNNLQYMSSNNQNGVTTSTNPMWAKIEVTGGGAYYKLSYSQSANFPQATYITKYEYVDANGNVTDLMAETSLDGVKPSKNTPYGTSWMDFSKAGAEFKLDDLYGQGFSVGMPGDSNYYSVKFTNGPGDSYEEEPNKVLSVDISGCTPSTAPELGKSIVSKIVAAAKSTTGAGGSKIVDANFQLGFDSADPTRLYVFDNRGENTASGSFELITRGTDGEPDSKEPVTKTKPNGDVTKFENKDMWIQSGELKGSGIMLAKSYLTEGNIGLGRVLVNDFESASSSLEICEKALELVNTTRAEVGAYMNRFEHAIAITDNTSENAQAAESRIRDTDMADEMVKYSKESILSQAGQAMLVQANQTPQGVLKLLG